MNFSFSRIVARIVASCHFNDKATGFVMSNSIIKTARRTFVLGLAFCFTAALAGCSEKPEPVSFSAQTDDGVFNSTQHKGDVIYLDFWASWCGPCRESFPWMNEMLAKYDDKGLQIIGVSLDHDKNLARRFAEEFKAEFTIGFDVDGSIADQFQVKGLPSSVIIDREGRLFESHTGFNEVQAKEFEAALVKALN